MLPTGPRTPETSKSKPVSRSDSSDNLAGATLLQRRPPATLISSLSIPVKGAIPIPKASYGDKPATSGESQVAPVNGHQPPPSTRTPRKSKTEALAAIESGATALNAPDDVFLDDSMVVEEVLISSLTPLSPPEALDLASVKTSTSRDTGQMRRSRPFDLEVCPTFHPTRDEFADATSYIQSISDVGKKYGICKIVPPEGWKMPFVTDTTVNLPFYSIFVID